MIELLIVVIIFILIYIENKIENLKKENKLLKIDIDRLNKLHKGDLR